MEHLRTIRKNSIIQEPVQRIIVGVAGGSAAGKTTLCENINRQMAFDNNFQVQVLSLDSFYKDIDTSMIDVSNYNFDHPNALDFDLAYETLRSMKETNERVPVPQYSFVHHKRLKESTWVSPANIILFEGLMAFHDPRIRDLLTYKVFISCDDDIRLCRRLKRDTTERGRTVEGVLNQYNRFVKQSFKDWILPTMFYADIVIPGFRNNRVSVDFIVQHIKNIARRINYQQTAARTKIYIFGENEIYDFEFRENESNKMEMYQESFLVFPTSEEHKKELEFFMSRLTSEVFSYEYYQEICLCQFMKIQKALLKQLFTLKKIKAKDVEVISEHNIDKVLKYNLLSKPVKVIFFPLAYSSKRQGVFKLIKEVKSQEKANGPKTTFIILTIFCDMNFPRQIYKLKMQNLILIDLFVIANDQKFRETLKNNMLGSQSTQTMGIDSDHDLANQCAYDLSMDLKLKCVSDLVVDHAEYREVVGKMKKSPVLRQLPNGLQQLKNYPIRQVEVYDQLHENLCGYHSLINIILRNREEDIKSEERFIKYYRILSKMVDNHDYKVLERFEVPTLLNSNYFEGLQIAKLYFSEGYIINDQQTSEELQKCINQFNDSKDHVAYVLMGVYDHFFMVELRKQNEKKSIVVLDSANIDIADVMNGTNNQKTNQDMSKLTKEEIHLHERHMANCKIALEIVIDLFLKSKELKVVDVERRIDEIIPQMLSLKTEKQIEAFIRDYYPIPVLKNDLLTPLSQVKPGDLSEKHQKLLKQWNTKFKGLLQ